jgi:hypothetical protein
MIGNAQEKLDGDIEATSLRLIELKLRRAVLQRPRDPAALSSRH